VDTEPENQTEMPFMERDDLVIDNLPNRITIFRVLLIPIVMSVLYLSDESVPFFADNKSELAWIAGWMCAFASMTDFFDGYIARKRNIVTVFGSFLDPIADKFLIVSSLIMLATLGRVHVVIAIVLVLREMYITSLRLLASSEGIIVPVDKLGKWKTFTQMVAVPWLMANQTWYIFDLALLGTILIYVAAFLSLLSAFQYTASLIQKLKITRQSSRDRKKTLST
jgi:CDP-diacylglycerol--glycerol-3-phosphate 3-phosphatidyltransferase